MTDKKSLLNSFDNPKLIDIIKNYRQYGYTDELRNEAIDILKSRGIDQLDLELTGNFINKRYDDALFAAEAYKGNSRVAFALYTILIVDSVLIPTLGLRSETLELALPIMYILVITLFLVFLIRSFINHIDFYKLIGKKLGTGDQIIYFLVGMPFYIFMYFFYRSQIKEELKMIQ